MHSKDIMSNSAVSQGVNQPSWWGRRAGKPLGAPPLWPPRMVLWLPMSLCFAQAFVQDPGDPLPKCPGTSSLPEALASASSGRKNFGVKQFPPR